MGAAATGLIVAVGFLLASHPLALQTPGAAATALGRLTAVIGTYGVLLTLLLAARLPWLERRIGQETLVWWHRRIAPWALVLVGVHMVATTLGYAAGDAVTGWRELWLLTTQDRWILPAVVGFGLMVTAAVASMRAARRRVKYETWWVLHLYTYLAVAFSFAHQVLLGSTFVGHPAARAYWIGLYLVTVGALLAFRVGLPLLRWLRHDLRVIAVVPESADAVSVVLRGRNLDQLPVRGGQWFAWRFLTPGLWWQAHPYSLSAPAKGDHLRITVRIVGDHTAALARLRPGTRVLAEGPYGVFTSDARHGDRVVLVAGGAGIAPIRGVLEDLPATASVDLLFRAPSNDRLLLQQELQSLAASRPNVRLHYLVGGRAQYPMRAATLGRFIPDIGRADVYVCGPASLVNDVTAAVRALGVPSERIHAESFSDS